MYPSPPKKNPENPEVLELLDFDGSHGAQVSEPSPFAQCWHQMNQPLCMKRVSAKNQPPDRETGWFMTPGST